MTYEEYRSNKEDKNKTNYFKVFLNKLFTIIIFTMIIIILCNYSSKFKSFVVDEVLNTSLDFSKFNKIINKTTSIFNNSETLEVFNNEQNSTKYLDGLKYIINENENIYAKDGGIVTYIGNKEGYNNTIIIQQSNGYYAWYGNVKESVKLYDYVERGSIIASASNEYYFVLLKDDKPININEN